MTEEEFLKVAKPHPGAPALPPPWDVQMTLTNNAGMLEVEGRANPDKPAIDQTALWVATWLGEQWPMLMAMAATAWKMRHQEAVAEQSTIMGADGQPAQ